MQENILTKITRGIALRLLCLFKRKSIKQLFFDELLRQVNSHPEISILFPENKIIAYAKHEPVKNVVGYPGVYITQIRYYWMYRFFKEHYSDIFNPEVKILKVGDPSGNLLETLGKRGTSVNINPECISFIRDKGLDALCLNAEDMEFEDASFDYVFCFQCLEHIHNPIKALNEFGRIARKKVFISIPYTARTNIYNAGYWLNEQKKLWGTEAPKVSDCHIFEFSTEDFKKILSFTNLDYGSNQLIYYFSRDYFLRRILNFCIRPYFNFFILEPRMKNGKM